MFFDRAVNSSKLFNDIVKTFRVSKDFVRAYMELQADSFKDENQYEDWNTFAAALGKLELSYIEFALTCVLRAHSVADLIQKEAQQRGGTGKRYLDVGCGYGGFVREFSLRGYRSVGIELQEHLAKLSEANCSDIPDAKIICGDILAQDTAALGKFDIVTCNDVIEHVKDPATTMNLLASLLNPGGYLFLEIPNKDCIESVRIDGHFQIFGLTQLPRNSADALLLESYGRRDYLEQMGEMYPLSFYVDALSQNGLQVDIHQKNVISSVEQVPNIMQAFHASYAEWKNTAVLNPMLARQMETALSTYLSHLWKDYAAVQGGQGRTAFQLKYLNSFWSVLAQRNS